MSVIEINPRLSVQEVQLDNDSLTFMTPFSMSVSGPSQSKFQIYFILVAEFINFFHCQFFFRSTVV
jgi:hypothetical protein